MMGFIQAIALALGFMLSGCITKGCNPTTDPTVLVAPPAAEPAPAAAAPASPAAAASRGGAPYIVVGDSVMWHSQNALAGLLPGVVIDAKPGRGPDDRAQDSFGRPRGSTLREAVAEYAPQVAPGGWLIITESGDWQPVTEEFVHFVDDTVPPDVCLLWVTPNNIWVPDVNAASVAAMLTSWHPCVDWDRWDLEVTEGHSTDGVHLLPDFEILYAQRIADLVS